MPSIIGGYNYDIFISYRQKDNKHDGWVTEFVDNLKGELESTFKEEISVYFDINPHDGLLETHDVDASLKEKLKCLVFIPIISRTYCDPKSFAWGHEFKTFVEQASKDKFGIKVKLPNGNVASRVLPVRIYDLDDTDVKLCESLLGGVLRGVEFIYKEPGVNRPLKYDDDEKINLNKTKYRNQINKISNSIKELIQGLSSGQAPGAIEEVHAVEPNKEIRKDKRRIYPEKPGKSGKRKWLSMIGAVALLIIASIIAYPKIFKQNRPEKLWSSGERIAVAIMPFQNMTNDTKWNVWQDGIQDILITSLSNSEGLTVRHAESINSLIQNEHADNNASITPSVAGIISQKLDAGVFIYGNLKQAGSILRVYTQLIDSRTNRVLKSFQIESPAREELIFQIIDSLSVMIEDFFELSELIKEGNPDDQKAKAAITSPKVYRHILDGDKALAKLDYPTAIKMYLQALAIDSTFPGPFLSISWAYRNQGQFEKAREWYLRAYEKSALMSKWQRLDADVLHASLFGTPYESIGHLRRQLEFDDQNPLVYNDLGAMYIRLLQYDKAIPEYEKALEIYNKWGVKPFWVFNYTGLGIAYHNTGQYGKEQKLYKKAEKDFPDNPELLYRQAILSLAERHMGTETRYIDKYISVRKGQSWSEADITASLAAMYSEASILDKAEKYYRQSLSLEPENPSKMNNLARFLIDKDQNINEGLELADKALELDPDNYLYLDTKGWGLYKLGKFEEALALFQNSDSLRPAYSHRVFLHLEEAKKAVASQKNN